MNGGVVSTVYKRKQRGHKPLLYQIINCFTKVMLHKKDSITMITAIRHLNLIIYNFNLSIIPMAFKDERIGKYV